LRPYPAQRCLLKPSTSMVPSGKNFRRKRAAYPIPVFDKYQSRDRYI
jgi:hypothetical protein